MVVFGWIGVEARIAPPISPTSDTSLARFCPPSWSPVSRLIPGLCMAMAQGNPGATP